MAVGQQIEAIQRRAARVITGGTYDVRSKEILQNLNWTPIEQSLTNPEIIMTLKLYLADY